MSGLLNHATRPVITVPPESKVIDAADLMTRNGIGAVAVVDREGRPVGILSERDLMTKVLSRRLDAERTLVRDVMTSPVVTLAPDAGLEDAVEATIEHRIRHIPIVDDGGRVVAMLSIRHVMEDEIEELRHEVGSLTSYVEIDSIGG